MDSVQQFFQAFLGTAQVRLADWTSLIWTVNVFGVLAIVFNLGSNVPYIRAVWVDPAIKPSSSTWIIWGSLDGARIYFMWIAGIISYQMIGSVIGIIGILGAGLIKSKLIGWSLLDFLVAGTVGAVMYAAYKFGGTPFWMLLASLVALTLGALPMYWKTIWEPYSEPVSSWVMVWLACLFQMLSTPKADLAAISFANGYFVFSVWEKIIETVGVSAWIMVLTSILIVTMLIRRSYIDKPEEVAA